MRFSGGPVGKAAFDEEDLSVSSAVAVWHQDVYQGDWVTPTGQQWVQISRLVLTTLSPLLPLSPLSPFTLITPSTSWALIPLPSPFNLCTHPYLSSLAYLSPLRSKNSTYNYIDQRTLTAARWPLPTARWLLAIACRSTPLLLPADTAVVVSAGGDLYEAYLTSLPADDLHRVEEMVNSSESWLELRTGLRYTDVPVFLYGTRTGISFLPYRIRTV